MDRLLRKHVRLKFTCPKCKGNEFGSSGRNVTEIQRFCHTSGCGFNFHTSDDYRYFTVNDKIMVTKEGFENAVYTYDLEESVSGLSYKV